MSLISFKQETRVKPDYKTHGRWSEQELKNHTFTMHDHGCEIILWKFIHVQYNSMKDIWSSTNGGIGRSEFARN